VNISEVKLPDGIHATVLTGQDVYMRLPLAYPVVWADRPYQECPRCDQPINRTTETSCPVMLNTGSGQGGQIEEFDQQHRCGEWLPVLWQEVPVAGDEVTEGELAAAAQELAVRFQGAVEAERAGIRKSLRDDLAEALKRLAEPLVSGETAEERAEEVRTGSEVEPGVRQEDGVWLAWANDPLDTDPITIDERDLEESS